LPGWVQGKPDAARNHGVRGQRFADKIGAL
jgi:hypothetical protein